MRKLLGVLAVVAAWLGLGWLGLLVRPARLPRVPFQGREPATVPLPEGLPALVERFLRATYGGDQIPVVSTVVLSGTARMRPAGPVFLPARFRFVHVVGDSYRHHFEATWFGLPFLRVNEGYVDGSSFFEAPLIGAPPNHPKLNQGANLALWTETMLFPAALVLDPRVSWEPVDDTSARLIVPFEEGAERILVRFDPNTGLAREMEVMRYRGVEDNEKILWIPRTYQYANQGGVMMGVEASAQWADQSEPWASFRVEHVVINPEFGDYIRSRGA